MNIENLILWGFAATLILTVIMTASRHFGLTRMDIPFMLGTMVTPSRNKAPWAGFLLHLFMGWLFAFIYGAAFETSGIKTWWFGLAVGSVHAAFVLSAGLQILNFMHPKWRGRFKGQRLQGCSSRLVFLRLIMEREHPSSPSLPTWYMAAY